MNKKKAISILQNQKKKLKHLSNHEERWIVQTRSYIKDFFGIDSSQYKFLSKGNLFFQGVDGYDSNGARTLSKFMDDCIEVLENIGLKKKERKNLLNTIPDKWLIPICIGFISLGTLLGSQFKDIGYLKLENELKKSNDSITRILSDSIPYKVKDINSYIE